MKKLTDIERKGLATTTGFTQEAEAFLKVAQILDGRPKEEACAILAGVCSSLGFYDQARIFIDLAQHWRAVDEAAAADAEG